MAVIFVFGDLSSKQTICLLSCQYHSKWQSLPTQPHPTFSQ